MLEENTFTKINSNSEYDELIKEYKEHSGGETFMNCLASFSLDEYEKILNILVKGNEGRSIVR